ncbi:acyltransferase [Flavobacterium sp. ZT3R17]|uniref:acyltransferase n=1 Tax=Flavobacterium cryoconiti TaxID=3398736 RepID=UPI003A8AF361
MNNYIHLVLKLFCVILPWSLRRRLLILFFGYELDKSARIGFSWIYPSKLIMKSNSRIGSLNVAVHLDVIEMNEFATIARSNWITGFSTKTISKHFVHQLNRSSSLIIGAHSAITKHHHIDCTSSITIGKFVTIAGYNSQLLTHSIDIFENKQDSHPILIGDYCFVGTDVVILGGSILPSYSVLGAKALLNKDFKEEYTLYGGVPAKAISVLPRQAKYFVRKTGFVH